MNLSDKDKGILRRIVTDPAFDLFKQIENELFMQWSIPPMQGETSFLIAQEALKRQERREGIKLFIKTIEDLCQ